MGKFNKKTINIPIDQEKSVDWSQLIADFENSSVEQAIENIMLKITTNENIEFDQACLVLKHYLLLDDNKTYLNHFLKFNQSVYFNALINRFNTSNSTPNVTWMISELIKVLTSVCDLEQANYMLSSEMFRTILCTNIFDTDLLNKLNKSNTNHISLIESATLTNMFETVSNLCDINNNLINFLTPVHIEWMYQALIITDSNSNKNLIVSIARLFHLFTELFKTKENSSDKIEMIMDLFLNKKFIQNAFSNLTIDSNNNNSVCNNLVTKLYLIGTFINVVLSNQMNLLNRNSLITNLMQEYGSLFENVLNNKINNSNDQFKLLEDSNKDCDESDYKALLKSIEALIECKLLAIDMVKQILNYFTKEDEIYNDEEEEELVESDDENCNEMETEQQSDVVDSTFKNESITINVNNLFASLLTTVLNDDENFMQNTNKIEHIFNSVNLIKLEASQTCLSLIQFIQTNNITNNNISIVYVFEILKWLLTQSDDESTNDLIVGKLAELCSNLFIYLNNTNHNLEINTKLELISLIKDVLFKYKTDDYDLCIELSRILTLISIKERNLSNGSIVIIDSSARILIDLISASFELNDQMSIKSLKLNAELIDFLIDLFSEDNLKELELNLNFIEKIQLFSEKFYFKYKTLASKKKLKKDDGLIVRTVRDNLKPFIEYKIQKLK